MPAVADNDVVIVEAARSPLGKPQRRVVDDASGRPPRDGVHRAVIERSGIDPRRGRPDRRRLREPGRRADVQHRPHRVAQRRLSDVESRQPPSTASADRSQQATNLATSLIKADAVDVAIGCGVESMSRVPSARRCAVSSAARRRRAYLEHYELTSQFEGAERIADKWGITRADCDAFGLQSQQRAARAMDRRSLRARGRAGRRARPRRGRQAHGHHAPSRARRRPARDVAREARQAQAGRARRTACTRPARARRSPMAPPAVLLTTAARARGARSAPAGSHRRPVPRGRRPGADAHRAHRRDPTDPGAAQDHASTTST